MPKQRRSTEEMQREREQLDIQRMQLLTKWPCWPWLPMKRGDHIAGMQLACMHADHVLSADGKPRLFHVTVTEAGRYWLPGPTLPFEEFDSLEAIVAAGWRID